METIYSKMRSLIEKDEVSYMCNALSLSVSWANEKALWSAVKYEIDLALTHNGVINSTVEGYLLRTKFSGEVSPENLQAVAKYWRLDWLQKKHEEEIKRIQSKEKETVYSLLHSVILRNEDSFICNALMRMYRDGKVTEAEGEKVRKAIKSELGDARTVEEMLGVMYPHTEARAWRLAWLKEMHEETLEKMQQLEKVEHMKTLSFKEAMYALADGKALWREDGTFSRIGFTKDEQYVIGEHPHAEVIRAFGEGKEIEYYCPTTGTWRVVDRANFGPDKKYRVKSEFDFSEGNTILKHDGSMWTITTGTKLRAMAGLGMADDKLVVFSQNMQSNNGISWDLLENCIKNAEISHVFVAAKNRK